MNLYIVTGTTRGLGKALAEAIARSPANELISMGRAPDRLLESGAHLDTDLADRRSLEHACDRIDERVRGKRYDKAVLVNNAGIVAPVGPLGAVPADELERNLVVNFVAPMLLMRRFLIATEATAPLRRIVNISSGAARRPVFGWSGYCAAKAGLEMASRVVALEASTRGLAVEVASLAPGVIDTDMQALVRSQSPDMFVDVERFRLMKESGQLRSAAEVADEILRAEEAGRLASDPVLDLRTLAG